MKGAGVSIKRTKTIHDKVNEDAAGKGTPPPVSGAVKSKVEKIIRGRGGNISMSQLEKELSASDFAYIYMKKNSYIYDMIILTLIEIFYVGKMLILNLTLACH